MSSSHAQTVLPGAVISKRSSHLKYPTWRIKEISSVWKEVCYEIIPGEVDSQAQGFMASGCFSWMSVGLALVPISVLRVCWNRTNTHNNLWKMRLWFRDCRRHWQEREACIWMPRGEMLSCLLATFACSQTSYNSSSEKFAFNITTSQVLTAYETLLQNSHKMLELPSTLWLVACSFLQSWTVENF